MLLLLLSHFSHVRLCATHRRQPTKLPGPWDSPGKNTGVGCHFLLQCRKVKSEREVAESYPTLSDPMDWAHQAPLSMRFSRQEYWSGCHCLKHCFPQKHWQNALLLISSPFQELKFNWDKGLICIPIILISTRIMMKGNCTCIMNFLISIHQFSSVAQSCPTLCDPMDCSTPALPVHYQLLKFTQTHVHWVGDAIQPSHPLSSPSPPAFNLFQHQGLFKWVSSSHQVAKVLEFQLQPQTFQWIFRTDLL